MFLSHGRINNKGSAKFITHLIASFVVNKSRYFLAHGTGRSLSKVNGRKQRSLLHFEATSLLWSALELQLHRVTKLSLLLPG